MNPGHVRAFGRTLAKTEWLSTEELRTYQVPLISKLLLHARQTTNFYRDRVASDSPEEIEGAWSSIPVLSRAEAVAKRVSLISRSVPVEVGRTESGETSGSTGYPFPYLRSEIIKVANQALNERMMRWWKVDGRKTMCQISFDRQHRAPSLHGATSAGWQTTHPEASFHFLSTAADVETQVRWLANRKPAYLTSYASLLKELARACRKSRTRLKFELLFSVGTVLDQETRDLCRTTFGAEIADTYGAEEAGHIASQCPECGEYHVSEEAARVEILRSDGSPAQPGEVGRVVITPFYNYAMPLIRYELGDLAELGPKHARCGRGLTSLRRILGRYRNVFRFRDGKIASPSAVLFRLRDHLPLTQSQIVQLDLDRIEIRWVSDGTDRPIDLAALTSQVRSVLRQPIEVSVRRVDVIERSPSGKFEDCVSLVPHE
jgi:phenylacetate-coenzyme A ligase PaaK-like adenylate-forming protein